MELRLIARAQISFDLNQAPDQNSISCFSRQGLNFQLRVTCGRALGNRTTIDVAAEMARVTLDVVERTIFSDGFGSDAEQVRVAMATYFAKSVPSTSSATSCLWNRSTGYPGADWEKLKAELTARRVRVVALNHPTSCMMGISNADEFTSRMFEAINGMLLDILAAVARKDYDDRRRRQAQGQARAKAEGRYKGRPEDTKRNDGIACMLKANQSWGSIQSATGCSRATVPKIAKRISA